MNYDRGSADRLREQALRQGELSLGDRNENLDRLGDAPLDILIVGGGILGCGVALEASGRGLNAGLVDAGDFAGGTSSRSSKLIHAGLRYLQHLEFGLTWEASEDRRKLSKQAPGLVRPVEFALPAYSRMDAARFKVGLLLYDAVARFRNKANHRSMNSRRAFDTIPQLRRENLRRLFLYYDAVTDDSRLTLQVAKVAASLGAVFANYARVTDLLKEEGVIRGVVVHDLLSDRIVNVTARKVILACGVWLDDLLRMDSPDHRSILKLSKGVTLVVSGDGFPSGTATLMPSRRDGRLVFAIPWHDRILISTTDTPYDGDLRDPAIDQADVDYLLGVANDIFPQAGLSRDSVIGSQAGLRPLIARPGKRVGDLSRRERLVRTRSGMVGIAGGKLTSFQSIARRTLDRLLLDPASHGDGVTLQRFPTGQIPLLHRIDDTSWRPADDSSRSQGQYFERTYGADGLRIQEEGRKLGTLDGLIPGLPYAEQEVLYAVRHEMAVTVTDFLARRVRATLLDDRNGLGAANRVAEIMAGEVGWRDETRAEMLLDYQRFVERQSSRSQSIS